MAEKSHPSIKNPENFPSVLRGKLNQLLEKFADQYSEEIKKGCTRNYCSLPADKLAGFLKKNGFSKAKLKKGTFLVDDPRPLSLNDFTDEERALARSQGLFLRFPETAWKFAVDNNLVDELKRIPHYWTAIGDLIIDFTADEQFVKTGMSADTNAERYKTKLKEQQLNEVGNSSYNFKMVKNDLNEFMAEFTTDDDVNVVFQAIATDDDNYIWDVAWTADGSMGRTNSGDQFKILSTVMKLFNQFILYKNPKMITFTADKIRDVNTGKRSKTARSKIYKRAVEMIAKKYDYSIKIMDINYADKFVLRKIEK